jgi:exodeoxyribonuclease III
LATWNVNSARARLPRFVDWLDRLRPDIACLQETKLINEDFLGLYDEDLFRRGYRLAHHGDGRWNGVGIVSRVGLEDVRCGLVDVPGVPTAECRSMAATCAGVRVWSIYVPNGRTPVDPQYAYKLAWLAELRDRLSEELGDGPLVVCGDFNIAPADNDVWDREAFVGATHVTEPERRALAELQALGLVDVLRRRWPQERAFTYWDYRAGMFPKDLGMRIDLVLATEDLAARMRAAWVDRQARKGKEPSDHAPVVVDFDEAPDGDIGPVVPPPSTTGKPGPRDKLALPPRA